MRPTNRQPTPLWVRLEQWIEEQTGQWGGPTQTDIAKALDLSTSAITEWKYGDSVPSMDNLQALSEFTKIPFAELVDLIQQTIQARRANRNRPLPESDVSGKLSTGRAAARRRRQPRSTE